MGKLGEIYSSVGNPLDNKEFLQKIVAAYAKSSRTTLISSSDLYSFLVKMNQTHDSSSINLSDRETFYIETYNQWIENILSLDDAHIEYLETKKGMDARAMQQYLRSFGKIASMEDIKRLKNNPLFDKEINGWELNDGWDHFKSQYISGRTENSISVKHRLYVGCQNQDMWKLAQLFKSKCDAQKIPYYFKLASSSNRDDKMVIYADTDNLANYISILQEIAQENPEIMQRCGKPPALTGKIDGWIGIGDEPPLKADGKKQSYNSLRADIFENAIEETTISAITEFKGKDVIYNGKQISFIDLFVEQAAQILLDKLDKGKHRSYSNLSIYGLTEKDLSNPKFKEHLKIHLKRNIQNGLDKLLEVKDIKSQIAGSNGNAIFSIPTRDGKSIGVNTYDMDHIIKSMVPIMLSIDPNFMDKAKSTIQIKCEENGIDDTFCFQQGSKERFERVDLQEPVKTEAQVTTSQTRENQPTSTKEKESREQQRTSTTAIRSIEIVDLLNPEVLKQKIELLSGAKIPARQYIQEIVAPHIPSHGTFILNNGSQISAKQFIEEYILGEGQEKYKGNISKLLSENTRSNNGTITINGEQINAIDIVNRLNPELMKRKVKLPNGIEIPATQYVQEFVAPYIPSDGKFILKSNGYGLSAKQFIEEAVMFEGQEKYNGDIIALLEAITVSNNGTVSAGAEAKLPKGKVSQQKKLSGQSVKKSILDSKITTMEVTQLQKEIAERKQRASLIFQSKVGVLTAEQQQHLDYLNEKYVVSEEIQKQSNDQRKSNGIGR